MHLPRTVSPALDVPLFLDEPVARLDTVNLSVVVTKD